MKKITRRTWLWAIPALFIFFLLSQLIQPDWETLNGTAAQVTGAGIQVPEDVMAILSSSCFACHSDENRLSWFDKITPANFLVASHIEKGKAVLNFSKWNELTPPQQKAQLFYSLNKILEKEMPLASYVTIHPEAKLTKEKVDVLKRYIASLAPRKTTATGEVAVPDTQSKNRRQKPAVVPAPNGIRYIEGYGNWKAISTTDRFDNETMRVIFANDIAVKAIEDQRTNPWPDGAVFAKVAWKEKADDQGNITPGEFYQAEFMIKDAKKYVETKGWGWARWRGMDLKPYGKNADFANECVSCHAPQKDNDYVFTAPLNLAILKLNNNGNF